MAYFKTIVSKIKYLNKVNFNNIFAVCLCVIVTGVPFLSGCSISTAGNVNSSSVSVSAITTSNSASTLSASSNIDSDINSEMISYVKNYIAMDFLNDKIGWIYQTISKQNAGSPDSAQLLKTTDGGQNWTTVNNFNSRFVKLDFINEKTGWAIKQTDVVNSGTQCDLMRTDDGGQNWTQQLEYVWDNSVYPNQLQFFDEKNGYFVENKKLLKTSDGGNTWSDITPPTDASAYGRPYFCFLSANAGWVTGNLQGTAVLYNTVDGGKHWTKIWSIKGDQFSGATAGLTFFDESTGWIILNASDNVGGYLYRTIDGGKNFYQVNTISTARPIPMKLYLTGESTGWIATDHGAGPICNGLMYTSDAGKTFKNIYIGQDNDSDCDDIIFPSPNIGFAINYENNGAGSYIAGTTDGGKTWHLLQ